MERVVIFRTGDYGAVTKIAPTLIRHQNDRETYIWSVDDDCAYPANQLETLCRVHDPAKHRILTRYGGKLEADGWYQSWYGNAEVTMFEGFGGVLYPPACIAPTFSDYITATSLNAECRKSDDIVLAMYFTKIGLPIYLYNQPSDETPYMVSGWLPYSQKDHLSAGGHRERYKHVFRIIQSILDRNQLTGNSGKRYNLGCGNRYLHGWINVDQFPDAKPDLIMNLEAFPWPIESNSVDEILLNHVLEHLGGTAETFLGVMKELYRISRPAARIVICVPDPRHDDFFGDPTHQRPIMPALFQTFDLASNENWVSRGLPGTPLGKYLRIDLETKSVSRVFDRYWKSRQEVANIAGADLEFIARSSNNAVQVWEVVLEARKPFAPGRSLRQFDAIVIQQSSGLSDVLMALAAVRALKAVTGLPILVCTSLDFIDLIRLSPSVDFGANTMEEIEAVLAQGKMMKPLIVDWGALRFATSRFHQVDAYLLDLGLTLPDIDKGLEIVLPHDVEVAPVHDILNAEAAGKLLVILHAASNHRNRIWSGEFWLDLSRRLLDEGYAVIVIGNTHRGDDRAALLSVPGVINLMDRFDHAGTIGLLRRCHILISNDATRSNLLVPQTS